MSLTATRGDIHVSPTFEPSTGHKPSPASVRVSNLNPFPLVIHDLSVENRDARFFALYKASAPIALGAHEARVLRIEASDWQLTRDSRAPLGPARFLIGASPEHLELAVGQIGALRMVLFPSGEDTDPEALDMALALIEAFAQELPLEEARRLQHIERLLKTEAALLKQGGEPLPMAFQSQIDTLGAVIPELLTLSCKFESRFLLDGLGHPSRANAVLERAERVRSLIPNREGLMACLDPEGGGALTRALVEAAAQHDKSELAYRLSKPFADGVQTPEPYKSALIRWHADRFETRWAAHHTAGDFFDLMRAMRELKALAAFDPEHPELAKVDELAGSLAGFASHNARERDFKRADNAMILLGELEKGIPSESVRELYEDTRAEVAYEHGRFIFHYRRGAHGMLDVADQAFVVARRHAPTRARLYGVGVVMVKNQFSVLAFLLLFIFGVWATFRAQLWSRLKLRLALSGVLRNARRGQSHRATPGAWRLITRMLALTKASSANERLRGRVASELMDVARDAGDTHLLGEAAGHMGRVTPSCRPLQWRTPRSPLEALARTPDQPLDAAALRAIDGRVALIAQIFGQRLEVEAARAISQDAHTRHLVLTGQKPAARDAFCQTVSNMESLLARPETPAWLMSALHIRLGLLHTAVGPALTERPEEAWHKAWAYLAPPRPTEVASCDGRALRRGILMAAAGGAEISEAVAVIEHEAVRVANDGDEVILRAALCVAARRARLPLPTPNGAPEAHTEAKRQALLALAKLDDLLTHWLTQDDALDARLRLAILRRLGGLAGGQAEADTDYGDDLRELFAQARQRRHSETTTALASVLDLLTDGDWGFDDQVAAAKGDERSLYLLLEALDHHASGRTASAAATLAEVDPSREGSLRAVRLLCARAIVAASIGRHQAALESLSRGHRAAQDDRARAVVETTAARLAALVIDAFASETSRGHADLLESACLGLLSHKHLPTPVWAWHTLGAALASQGRESVSLMAIERSMEEENTPLASESRRQTLLALSRLAFARGDYTSARHYVMMVGRSTEEATWGL